MSVYEIDPLQDRRWSELLERDARSSVFHTCDWLLALKRSYGYEPVVFTTSPTGLQLSNGVVFCRVSSWLTGKRLVSVPFSDHCAPLVNGVGELQEFTQQLTALVNGGHSKYVELRPRNSLAGSDFGLQATESFALHAVDLRKQSEELFQKLHKDSIRRKIQRAEREKLTYERGNNEAFLEKFYSLFSMTRKKHGLPPSPKSWFTNLLLSFGDKAQIRIASKDNMPVAGLFMLSHKNSVVYKYGGSDPAHSNLGGTPYLFWMTMLESQSEQFEELDLGRSDLDNDGLITFKDRLGGFRSDLTYWRLPAVRSTALREGRKFQIAKKMFEYVPNRVRIGLGNLLYRHLG